METLALNAFGTGYCGHRVLVTGHMGFKGNWLCLWLHTLGAEVIGLALDPPTEPSHRALVEPTYQGPSHRYSRRRGGPQGLRCRKA